MSKKPPVKVEMNATATLTPKDRAVLRVGAEQLERYDEALRELAGETAAKKGGHDDA